MKGLEDFNYCVKRFFPIATSSPRVRLSTGYITQVAERCPEMREFRIVTVELDSWPRFNAPWSSLVTLWLKHVEVARADGFASLGAQGVFPNLRNFGMASCHTPEGEHISRGALSRKSILLPDFRHSCQSLQSVILSDGEFIFHRGVSVFPQGLKELVINCVTIEFALGCVIPPAGAVTRSRNLGHTFLANSVIHRTCTTELQTAMGVYLPNCVFRTLNEPHRDFEDWWQCGDNVVRRVASSRAFREVVTHLERPVARE